MKPECNLLIASCGIIFAGLLQKERSCWIRPSLSRNHCRNSERLRDLEADDLIVNIPIHFRTFVKLSYTEFSIIKIKFNELI